MMLAVSVTSSGWMMALCMAVLGCIVGRFLNRCVLHFPEHLPLRKQLSAAWSTPATCHRCGAAPTTGARIPVLGLFLSGGRCHQCQAKWSRQSLVMELLTGGLFALLYLAELPQGWATTALSTSLHSAEGPYGPEVITAGWSEAVWLHARYALHLVMLCGLIVATAIDFRLRIIPDGSTVPVMIVGVIASGLLGQLFIVPIWFQDESTARILRPFMPTFLQGLFVPWDAQEFIQGYPSLHGLLASVLGFVVGGGSVWLVRLIGFWVLKQEAMGFGDVVLIAMIGSVIGWQPVLAVFMLAPLIAISAALLNWILHKDREIPYGPFLSAATVLLLLAWPVLWPLAKRFFDMGPFFFLLMVTMVGILGASLQLIQLVKRLLGLQSDLDIFDDGGWSSADHLSYYHRKVPDDQVGKWPRQCEWPGEKAGRGTRQLHRWKGRR